MSIETFGLDYSYIAFFVGVALVIICCGIYSLLATRHLIRVLIAIGLFTKSLTLLLLTAGWWGQRVPYAEALIITVIVVEVVVMVVGAGLALSVFREQGDLDLAKLKNLRG